MKWIELILLSILLFIVIIILFVKIKIRIYKRGNGKGEIDIYLTIIKHIHIDIGKVIRKYIEEYSMRENINKALMMKKIVNENISIIDKLTKCIIVKRIIFVPGYNTTSPIFYPYVTIINWQIIGIIKRYLNKFKRVEYEYYQVMMNDETKKGFNIDMLLEIPINSVLYILLTNIKDFIKLIKSYKGGKNNGRRETIN